MTSGDPDIINRGRTKRRSSKKDLDFVAARALISDSQKTKWSSSEANSGPAPPTAVALAAARLPNRRGEAPALPLSSVLLRCNPAFAIIYCSRLTCLPGAEETELRLYTAVAACRERSLRHPPYAVTTLTSQAEELKLCYACCC
ncbi:hypothetical protein BTVI_145383 [Pitangus sulphuratus]|nr:hypothetical protein BTVI_145383 [Pitangus sulphuratus]